MENTILRRQRRNTRRSVRVMRRITQASFFVLFLLLITGTVCTVIVTGGVEISEPLGVIQFVSANISQIASIGEARILIVGSLLFLGTVILLGRAFCAWACPLGTVIDTVDAAIEKLKFKPYLERGSKQEAQTGIARSGASKYAVLVAVLTGSALLKYPAWCALCPIGTLCRGLVAGAEIAVGTQFLAIPAVGALGVGRKRFWCRYICPVGGLLSLLSRLNPFIKPRIRRDAQHRDCGACQAICPEGIDVCNERSFARCTKCLECYANCPFGAVSIALM